MTEMKRLVPKLRFRGFEDNWKTGSLKKIAAINPKTRNLPEEFIYIDLESVTDGRLVKEECISINEAPSRAQRVLDKDDILYQTVRPYQKNNFYFNRTGDYVASTGYAQIKSKGDSKYLFQFLHTTPFVNIVNRWSTGTSYPAISPSELAKIAVAYPSLNEQQKIASFLTAIDKKIEQLNQKKSLLEQYKKGVMQQLFSQQLRFKDDDGGEFSDWEEKKLGDVSSNISYGMNAAAKTYDGQNKYLRITDIDEFSNRLNNQNLTSPNGMLEEKFRVKEGDILFARTGASVGKSYLYRSDDGVLYFAGFLIRFRIQKAIPEFIYLQTQLAEYNQWVKVMSMRSGQPGINAEEYKILKIVTPCKEEQQKIASYLTAIDDKIAGVNQQLEQTQEFKKGLLQQMFV